MQYEFFNKTSLTVLISFFLFTCIMPKDGVVKKLQIQLPMNGYNKRNQSEISATKIIRTKTSTTVATAIVQHDIANAEYPIHRRKNIKNTPLTFKKIKRTLKNSYEHSSKRRNNLQMNYMPVQSNNKRRLLQKNDQNDFHRKQRDQTIVKYFHVPKQYRAKKKVHHNAIPLKYTTVQIEVEPTDLDIEDSSMHTFPDEDSAVKKKHIKKSHKRNNKFHTTFEASEAEAGDEDSSIHTFLYDDSRVKKKLSKKSHKTNHKFHKTFEDEAEAGNDETEVSGTYYIPNNERSIKKKIPYKTWKKAHNLENSFADDFISALKSELKSQHSTEVTSESQDSLLIEKEKETDFQKLAPITEDIKAVSEDAIIVKKEKEIFESQEGLPNARDASRLNDVPLENYEQDNEYDRNRVIEMPNLGATDSYVRIKKDVNSVRYENKTTLSINSNKKRDISRKMDEFSKFIEKFEETRSYTEFVTSVSGDSEIFSYNATSAIHNSNDGDSFSSSYSYNDATQESTTEVIKSYMSELSIDNYSQNVEETLNYNTTGNIFNFLNNSNYPENVSEKEELTINHRSMKYLKFFEDSTEYRAMKSMNIMTSTEDDSGDDITDSYLAKDSEYPLLKNKSSKDKIYNTDAKYLKIFEDEITQASNIAHYANDEESKTRYGNNRKTTSNLSVLKPTDQSIHNKKILANVFTSKGTINPLTNIRFKLKKPIKLSKSIQTKDIKMKNRKFSIHLNNRITASNLSARKPIDQTAHNRKISKNVSTSKSAMKLLPKTNFIFKNPHKLSKSNLPKGNKIKNIKLDIPTMKHLIKKKQEKNLNKDLKNNKSKSFLNKIRLNLDCFINIFDFLKPTLMDENASAEYQYTLKHDEKGEKFAEVIEKTNNYTSVKHSSIKLRIFTIGVTSGVSLCILLTVVAIYLTRKNAILEHRPLFEREKEFIWRDGEEERKNYANHRFSYKGELKKFIRIPADTDSENKEIKSPSAAITKIEQLKCYLPSISIENEWLNTYEKHKKKQCRRNWFRRFLDLSCVQSIVQIFKGIRVDKTERRRCEKKDEYDTDISKNFLKSLWKSSPFRKTEKKETQQFQFLPQNLKTFFSDDEMSSEDELLNEKGIHLIDLTKKTNDLEEHNIPGDLLDPSSQHKHKVVTSNKHKTTMNKYQKTDNIVKNEVERISGYPTKDNSCSFLNEIKKAVDVAEKNITFPEPLPFRSTELLWKPL